MNERALQSADQLCEGSPGASDLEKKGRNHPKTGLLGFDRQVGFGETSVIKRGPVW